MRHSSASALVRRPHEDRGWPASAYGTSRDGAGRSDQNGLTALAPRRCLPGARSSRHGEISITVGILRVGDKRCQHGDFHDARGAFPLTFAPPTLESGLDSVQVRHRPAAARSSRQSLRGDHTHAPEVRARPSPPERRWPSRSCWRSPSSLAAVRPLPRRPRPPIPAAVKRTLKIPDLDQVEFRGIEGRTLLVAGLGRLRARPALRPRDLQASSRPPRARRPCGTSRSSSTRRARRT